MKETPKTVWTTHFELAAADMHKHKDQYEFNWRRLPKTAPEYLIELPCVQVSPKKAWVQVDSLVQFGPSHLITLHWDKQFGFIPGIFWWSRGDAVRCLARFGIWDVGRSQKRLQAALNTVNHKQGKLMGPDDLPAQPRPIRAINRCASGIDPEDDDPEEFESAYNQPLDVLLSYNRRRFGLA